MKIILSIVIIVFGILSTRAQCQSNDQWQAPSSADTLENPYELDDKKVLNEGKELYLMLCATCHGESGNGGGGAGQAFDPPPADFTTERVQNQSDGALFWKLSEGNPPGMLSYKKMLSEEERWQIVTYLRTFVDQ